MPVEISSLQSSSRHSTLTNSSASDSADVTARNRQVFRRYEKSFRDINDPSFVDHAEKFTLWLSNERGYYEGARPEILKLLMIMHNTLRRAVGVAETQHVPFPPESYVRHPMGTTYVKLVSTIHRHAHFFVEPNLQALLKGLFFSVGLQYIPNTGTSASAAWTSSTVIPPPSVIPSQYHVPNPANNTPAAPPQTIPTTQPHGFTPSSISVTGSATESTYLVRANQSVLSAAFSNPIKRESDKVQNALTQVNAGNTRSITASNSVGETSTVKVKVKKRKKKTLDLATLQELDVQSYLQKRERAQPQSASGSSSGLATASSGQPSSFLVQPKVEETPVSLDIPPPRPLPPSSHEVIEILDTPEPSPPSFSAGLLHVKAEPQDDAGLLLQTPLWKTYPSNDDGVIDLTSDTEMEAEPITNVAEAPHVPTKDEVNGLGMEVDDAPSPIQESDLKNIAQTEFQPDPIHVPICLDVPSPVAPSPAAQLIPTAGSPPNNGNEEASMDVDWPGSRMSISSVGRPSATPIPHPPLEISIAGQTSVEALSSNDAQKRALGHAVDMSGVEETGSNEKEENEPPVAAVPAPVTDERIYGDEIKIVAFQRGLAYKSRIHFTFDLSEDYFNLITRWANQEASLSELRRSLCLSLICCPISQLALSAPLAPQLGSLSSSWPTEGGLSMKITYKSNLEHLSLSPPWMVSRDSTVDLSKFIQPGSNTFELVQRRNWSEHIFILLAHHPTPRQMEKVEEKRKEDQTWNDWLKQMAMPLVVKEFSFTAPNVTSAAPKTSA